MVEGSHLKESKLKKQGLGIFIQTSILISISELQIVYS